MGEEEKELQQCNNMVILRPECSMGTGYFLNVRIKNAFVDLFLVGVTAEVGL